MDIINTIRFWKKKPVEDLQKMDFIVVIGQIQKLSPRAQTTFLYRLIEVLPIQVVRTLQLYTLKRLEDDKRSNVGPKNDSVPTNHSNWKGF